MKNYIVYPCRLGELNIFRKQDDTKYIYEFVFEGITAFTLSKYPDIRRISQNSRFYTDALQGWFTYDRRDVFIDEYERD